MLRPEDFAAFFREVHGDDPFPWQQRLLSRVASQGWPEQLDLPTGSGKTAAIDIAVFHLALQAAQGERRCAPVRIAFVVDRRLVVDDAYLRACRLRDRLLASAPGSVSAQVADALRGLSLDGPPLLVRRLRGGLPREGDWARTPSQPTVLCSTVDQVGSRLLFRGYGVSDSMKPVHAGLIGADCLLLLDEAHLAEPFRQTLGWVRQYRSEVWRESSYASPWGMTLLTATPKAAAGDARKLLPFALDDADRAHPVLQRRLQARKPARLRLEVTEQQRCQAFVDEVRRALGAGLAAVGVVSNRVQRARDVFDQLRQALPPDQVDLMLLIGPSRPVQRDALARRLAPIRTGAPRELPKPLVVVATQCIEAGVDIDLDALFTEAAPIDALRQRFGRLNRAGRDITVAAAVVATKEDVSARADDAVYGTATREAWSDLSAAAESALAAAAPNKPRKGSAAAQGPVVDFGLAHFAVPLREQALTLPVDAPVLMPAHVDLLSQTAPVPAADPEVALHLHGPSRQPDAVTVVWRADLTVDLHGREVEAVRRLLTLMPPRAGEAIELPVWAVRRWLQGSRSAHDLADLPASAPEDDSTPSRRASAARMVFRWRGPNDKSSWLRGDGVRPGDTVVAPAWLGGVDEQGWNPGYGEHDGEHAVDVADVAAAPLCGRYFAVRVAPGLTGQHVSPLRLAEALSELRGQPWRVVRDALVQLLAQVPPGKQPDRDAQALVSRLGQLDSARKRHRREFVELDFDVYGVLDDGETPRGTVFVAPWGLTMGGSLSAEPEDATHSTEDDLAGSVTGFALPLQRHSADVEAKAEAFARAAGLPAKRVADLRLAGWLHDQGKRDPRFQRWLHHGDPLGADPDDEATVLAKSGRALPPSAREQAGLPSRWRHEALSVRLACRRADLRERLLQAADPDLVLWLVGTHHGHGRPLYPHADPDEPVGEHGPQSLAFEWNGGDWPMLFERLKARYGTWELARMEAILRLADHRASEQADNMKGAA